MSLALVHGGGTLTIRDSEEPADLEAPTTLTATVDDATGLIAEGTFSAAPLAFQFDITEPVTATVYVDAVFTQVTPGAATGTVTKLPGGKAAVSVGVDVRVDLHIEVGNPSFMTADCTATAVSLRLTSTVPYDYETDRVTLEDADFRVPTVPTTEACPGIIADGVNERLAGGGHAISMEMEGEVPPINIGIYPTTTALAVEPATSRQGDEVTLTASVAPDPDAEPDPGPVPAVPVGGVVELRDGATVLGAAPVDADGVATFATTALAVGHRSLVAAYQGDKEYAPSTSAPVAHLVAAAPTVTLPDPTSSIVIDGNPRPVTIDVANPAEFGAAIDGARLDITIARVGSLTSIFTPDRLTLEYLDGSTWTPVTLTETSPRVLSGSVLGLALAPGDEEAVRLRFKAFAVGTTISTTACNAPNPTCPGPLTLTARLVTGDGVRTLATDEGPVNLVEKSRRPTTAAFAGGVVRPHTVRQGYSLLAATSLSPTFGGVPWGGVAEAYLDGVQVPMRDINTPFEAGYTDQYAVRAATVSPWILLPSDIEPGTHWLTMRYLGDPFHSPAEVTATFTVLAPAGHLFVCRETTLTSNVEWGANVVFDAEVPALAPVGAEIDVTMDDARLLMHRQTIAGPLLFVDNDTTRSVGDEPLDAITFDLAGRGTASGTAVARTGGSILPNLPNPAPESAVDQTYDVQDVTGTVTLAGAPGEMVPVELTELVFDYHDPLFGFPLTARCVARGGPMVLGEVLVAGVSVSASPGGPVREGTDVTVEARTFPDDAAGTVAFSSDRDGALGVPVAVDDGGASLTVDDLSVGVHVVTAAFNATDPEVPDTSGTMEVTVLPRYDCPTFAQEGNAAVVRLVYLELLGRCPDQAGFDHWKGRLDGGTSREAFARTIARTPEAVGRVVDDAYQTMLGRPADAAGRAFWIGRLQASGRYDGLLADLGASGEFWSKAGSTNEGFVTRVYGRLLGRAPDDEGLDYWTGRLEAGASRRTLILTLAVLDEPLRRLVDASYGEILDRAPTASERSTGITFLRSTGDRSGLYAQLMGRAEFHTRAQGFPNPEG